MLHSVGLRLVKLNYFLLVFVQIVEGLIALVSLRQDIVTLGAHLELLMLPSGLKIDRAKRTLGLIPHLFFVLGHNLHWEHLLALDMVLYIILILLDRVLALVVLVDTPF